MEGFYPLRTRRKPPGRPLPSAHREGEQAAEGAEADEQPRRVVADVPAVQTRDRLDDRRRGALDRARPGAAEPMLVEQEGGQRDRPGRRASAEEPVEPAG